MDWFGKHVDGTFLPLPPLFQGFITDLTLPTVLTYQDAANHALQIATDKRFPEDAQMAAGYIRHRPWLGATPLRNHVWVISAGSKRLGHQAQDAVYMFAREGGYGGQSICYIRCVQRRRVGTWRESLHSGKVRCLIPRR